MGKGVLQQKPARLADQERTHTDQADEIRGKLYRHQFFLLLGKWDRERRERERKKERGGKKYPIAFSINHTCMAQNHCIHSLYWWFKFPVCVCAKSLQSCPTLCDPMDRSPPGSSVHGILQARILEWVAMPFSRGSSRPRDWSRFSDISCIGKRVLYH